MKNIFLICSLLICMDHDTAASEANEITTVDSSNRNEKKTISLQAVYPWLCYYTITHNFVAGEYPQADGATISIKKNKCNQFILEVTNAPDGGHSTPLQDFIGEKYLDNGYTGMRIRFTDITKKGRVITYNNPVIEQGEYFCN